MRLDTYSNPIFNDQELFDALYKGHQFKPDDIVFIEENTNDSLKFEEISGIKLFEPIKTPTLTVEDVDSSWSTHWNMPEEYKTLHIVEYLVSKCPKENYDRLIDELNAFRAKGMLDLLRWLKYFVDTCEKEGIVWGVGRGSSVASYALFLLGVHSIDSVKYNLDWQEFLR